MAVVTAAAIVVAILLALLLRDQLYPGGDAITALGWGDEVLAGTKPDFEAWAPAKHPLTIAFGALATLGGYAPAITLLVAFSILAYGLLGYAAYRLGRLIAGPVAGTVAAVVLLTRPEVVQLLATAQKDPPFAALTLMAAALFAENPSGRWRAAMVLLVAAGLIRPEAWALSGLLLFWALFVERVPRRGVAIALGVLAPLTWAGFDLALTGNPIHTFDERSARAAARDSAVPPAPAPEATPTDGVQGPSAAPEPSAEGPPAAEEGAVEEFIEILESGIVETVSLGVTIGGLLAFALAASAAWLHRSRPGRPPLRSELGWIALAVPIAVGVSAVGAIVALGTAVADRFLLVPAAALTVAWAGSLGLLARGERRSAVALGAFAAIGAGLVSVALAVGDDADRIEYALNQSEFSAGIYENARELAERPEVRAEIERCGRQVVGPPSLVATVGRVPIAIGLGLTMREIPVRRVDPRPAATAIFTTGLDPDGSAPVPGPPLASVGGWSFYGCGEPVR